MNPRIRSYATNFALVTVSIVVAVGLAESFLRLFPQSMPAEARLRIHWAGQPNLTTRPDPVTGFLFPAHDTVHFEAGEVDFRFTTDAFGFRNESPWPDTADIAMVGDSEVFGYGVDLDSAWAHRVGRALPFARVVNLGLPGMGPEQYRRVYERFAVPLHPKLLIFGLLPANDLTDQREFDAWLRAGAPGDFAQWKYARGNEPGLVQRLLERSALAWTVVTIAKSRRNGSSTVEPVEFPDGSRLHFAPTFLAREAQMATPGNPVFASAMQSIEKCWRQARENGTAFLVLVFPTKEDVYLPLRGDSVPRLLTAFTDALGARGIPYLDLTVPMQQEARAGKRLFFEVDGHPNAAGYRVIANAVLATLGANAATYGLPDTHAIGAP